MLGFFKDENGELSSNRLIFVVGSLWNFAISTMLLLKGESPTTILAMFSGIQGVLAGTKLFQKQIEKN